MAPTTVTWFVVAMFFLPPVATGNREEDLARLVRLLRSPSPKLTELYTLCGVGLGEQEGQLFLAACSRGGMSREECLKRNLERERQPATTDSLYVSWLRNKLPSKMRIRIQKVERRGEGRHQLRTELIWATLEATTSVTFMRVMDRDYQGHFGIVSVAMVNGVSVQDLLEEDLRRGSTPDIK